MKFRSESRGADTKEGVEESGVLCLAVDADALLGEGDGESGWVRSFFFAGLDGFVGNEPGVSTAAEIDSVGVTPPGDVGFVLIGDACGTAVEGDGAGLGEVEDVFVAVVDEALRVDGFEMPGGYGVSGSGVD